MDRPITYLHASSLQMVTGSGVFSCSQASKRTQSRSFAKQHLAQVQTSSSSLDRKTTKGAAFSNHGRQHRGMSRPMLWYVSSSCRTLTFIPGSLPLANLQASLLPRLETGPMPLWKHSINCERCVGECSPLLVKSA